MDRQADRLSDIGIFENIKILIFSILMANERSVKIILEIEKLLLSQWISSPKWSSSPAFYGNIFFLWIFGIHICLIAESSYSIYLDMNIAYPWAFLRQVTNFTGVTKFTGWPVGFNSLRVINQLPSSTIFLEICIFVWMPAHNFTLDWGDVFTQDKIYR